MGVILDSCIWVALAAQTLEHQTVIVTPPPRMGESEHGSIGANKQPLLDTPNHTPPPPPPVEREKEAVRHWKRHTWPALKKKPSAKAD